MRHLLSDGNWQAVEAATRAGEPTLRKRSNLVSATDGPFAETNEQIGGPWCASGSDRGDRPH